MDSLEILANLKIDLSIKSRIHARKDILGANIPAKSLIAFIKKTDEKTQVSLICVLDIIIEDYPEYLNNCFNDFIIFQQQTTNETCKRSTSRIIYHILKYNSKIFTNKQKEKLIEIHFNWLISKSLVATRVNCLSILFELRNQAEWITTELAAIIEQQILLQEHSFISRAKKILTKIHKEAK